VRSQLSCSSCDPSSWLCRIRKTTLEGCTVSVIGQNVDLTYPYNYLGEGAADLGQALKDEKFMQSFQEAKYPVVLVGPGILQRADRDTILQQVSTQQHKPAAGQYTAAQTCAI